MSFHLGDSHLWLQSLWLLLKFFLKFPPRIPFPEFALYGTSWGFSDSFSLVFFSDSSFLAPLLHVSGPRGFVLKALYISSLDTPREAHVFPEPEPSLPCGWLIHLFSQTQYLSWAPRPLISASNLTFSLLRMPPPNLSPKQEIWKAPLILSFLFFSKSGQS